MWRNSMRRLSTATIVALLVVTNAREKVTVATFVFVALDQNGRPRPVQAAAE